MTATPPVRLPVTVLSGFLGAGKTTLLQHILNRSERRLAIIVNDMSEVNVDAALVRRDADALTRTDAQLVEMSNGCICCTLRDDLLQEVARLAREGRFEGLIIESTGISEPIPIAQTFSFRDEAGHSLSDLARLDTLVTVVDAGAFLKDVGGGDRLADRGESLGEDDDRSVSALLVEQVEFADVIVINKTDRVDAAGLRRVEAAVRALNREAQILPAQRGQVPLEAVFDTGRFDFEQASRHAGWIQELERETHTPETEAYGIQSFVFRARRPFDAQALWDWMQQKASWRGVLRAKGFFWIGPRPQLAWDLSQAGGATQISPAGYWWAAVDRARWPEAPAEQPDLAADWDPVFGDRCQELVFIGVGLDEARIRAGLEAALVPAEAASDFAALARGADPFPKPEEPAP